MHRVNCPKIHYLGGRTAMKFKQQNAQNQRIERITSNHIVVGIDITKETQVADP